MQNQHFIENQTRLIDLFLAELSQSGSDLPVNFNNTKQFDLLLHHLESVTCSEPFNAVPSANVLHILLTLAARCQTSAWSHDTASSDSIGPETLEYMKQVNIAYEETLCKPLFQQRSMAILEQYRKILADESSGAGKDLLRETIETVLTSFIQANITSFFRPRRDLRRTNLEPIDYVDKLNPDIISDSEESDGIVDLTEPLTAAYALHRTASPKHFAPLSQLSSNLSGLGEAATLFKDMPHLLARASPEPEAKSPVKEPKQKKAKTEILSPKKILVFDDSLIGVKLLTSASYDLWSLLRWAFYCADVNTNYQAFLFGANLTHLHHIYKAYNDVLGFFFDICALQFLRLEKKKSILERLLFSLGPRRIWQDRAVEFLFTGLEIPSSSRPTPCYSREQILIKRDGSRKRKSHMKTHYTDNIDSIDLRVKTLALLFWLEITNAGRKAVSLSNQEENGLLARLVEKLSSLSLVYLERFYAGINAQRHHSHIPSHIYETMGINICLGLMKSYSGGYSLSFDVCLEDNLLDSILDSSVYKKVTDESIFQTMDEFLNSWRKIQFLHEWLIEFALQQKKAVDADAILERARLAEKSTIEVFRHYVNKHCADESDTEDHTFVVQAEDADRLTSLFTICFVDLVQFYTEESDSQ